MERDEDDPIWTHATQDERRQADRLQAYRAAYARSVTVAAGIQPDIGLGRDIAAAFGTIPREGFVGPPPWRILTHRGQTLTISHDPAVLYQDVLVSLGAGPGLNNGQPSLHAMCLAALGPGKGEHVIHVGAGTGYYTALLALLVGETGKVDAYEIERELVERARVKLAEFPQIAVYARSGAVGPLPECDVVYVSAAATEPLAAWLDALRPGGRLLFPLAPEMEPGAMLLITRLAEGPYAARFLCSAQFVPCAGAQDALAGRALSAAFKRGNERQVRWLYRNDLPDDTCWCAGRGWWLGVGKL